MQTKGSWSWDRSKQIDIAKLVPFMRRASWDDRWVLWKTSVDVVLADGRKVQFERLQPWFRIEGVDGTFFIQKDDIPSYETLRDRIVVGGNP